MSRRFQFSLWGLFLLTAGLALYFLALSHGGSFVSVCAMAAAVVICFQLFLRA